MSPFAAGCALCGAELDPRRHTRTVRPWSIARLPRPSPNTLAVSLLVLLTLFAPLIGLVICGLRAYSEERGGSVVQRNVALALGAVCLAFLLFVPLQLDVLSRLGLP